MSAANEQTYQRALLEIHRCLVAHQQHPSVPNMQHVLQQIALVAEQALGAQIVPLRNMPVPRYDND